MKTKHAPATPLPWNDLYVCTGALPAAKREHDVAYAFHAANAYPKLVEELRRMVEQWGRISDTQRLAAVIAGYDADQTARALLRSLGEEA